MKKIYSISHPVTGEVVYIGQTKDVAQRIYAHGRSLCNSPLRKWIADIRKQKLSPRLEVLETVEDKDAIKREKEIINQFVSEGAKLFNKNTPFKHKKGNYGKTFPLIKWVGFKGDTKELKRITGALTLTRAIEAVIKEKINQEAK